MGQLPKDLEEKRLRLLDAVRRSAFDSYIRRGLVLEGHHSIAIALEEAKNLGNSLSLEP